MGLHAVAVVKQVPAPGESDLRADGRLNRDVRALEINPYCRRAIAQAVKVASETGGTATVVTMGPPQAVDVLREALGWGADRAVLVSDPALAGSDAYVTARVLGAVIARLAPVDLVLCGRNSVDADTGQVPPAIAELLELPFACAVRELKLESESIRVRCERDDGWRTATLTLPAGISVAERLCEPAKVPMADWPPADDPRIERIRLKDLRLPPKTDLASLTVVGEVRHVAHARAGARFTGAADEEIRLAVELLLERGAFDSQQAAAPRPVGHESDSHRCVLVALEPARQRHHEELLGAASQLARNLPSTVVAAWVSVPEEAEVARLHSMGADEVVALTGSTVEEDLAHSLTAWVRSHRPWAVLAPGTAWGRELAARMAIRTPAGLVGDATAVEVSAGRLCAWKPALSDRLEARIDVPSEVQMVTIRPGVLSPLAARPARLVPVTSIEAVPRARLTVHEDARDDDLDVLTAAPVIVTVGAALTPEDYPSLEELLRTLGAELAATRKVTDRGWLPHSRQIGITGRNVSPRLYIALGVSGKSNHMVGVQRAHTVLAVNSDPQAPIFQHADVGIVAAWQDVVPKLAALLASVRSAPVGKVGSEAPVTSPPRSTTRPRQTTREVTR